MDNTIICLFGKKGSGKSTLAKEIAREWPRVIVLDTMSEYREEDNYVTAWGMDECVQLIRDNCDKKRYKLSLSGFDIDEGLSLLGIVWEIPSTFVVVDEAWLYSSPSQLPQPIADLVLRGRHREISSLWTSLRPAALNRAISSQADVIVAFRQHEERDIKYLSSIIGPEAEALRDLPDYQIMVYGNKDKFPLAVLDRKPRNI